jgi:hypothetical protein
VLCTFTINAALFGMAPVIFIGDAGAGGASISGAAVALVSGANTVALRFNSAPVGAPFIVVTFTGAGAGAALTLFKMLAPLTGSASRTIEYKVNPAIYSYFIACGSLQVIDGQFDEGIVTVEFLNGGNVVSALDLQFGAGASALRRPFMATPPDETLAFAWAVPGRAPQLAANSPASGFNVFRWSACADAVRFTARCSVSGLAVTPPVLTNFFTGVLQRAGEGGD